MDMKFKKKEYDRCKELSNCDFVKTILMLLVVIYHCMIYWTGEWFVGKVELQSNFLAIVSKWLNTIHIYGFTMVSGYLFYYLKHEQGKYQRWGIFVVNKIKRLLIPYIFVSVAWVIPFAEYYFKYDYKAIFIKYILGTSPNQLWFLLMLFGVFIIWWPLTDFFKNHTVKGGLLVLFFYAVGLIGLLMEINYFQIFRSCLYLVFFWVGFKIRQYGSTVLRKIPMILWIIMDIILFLIVQFLDGYHEFLFVIIKQGFQFLLNMVGAIMVFLVLQNIADYVSWDNRHFRYICDKTMPIYLFHQQVIYICIDKLNGVVNPYLHVLINFVVAMLISLLISIIMMRFKYTKMLIGVK